MGKHRSGWLSNSFVWITFVVMLLSAEAMFFTLARGQTMLFFLITINYQLKRCECCKSYLKLCKISACNIIYL